MECSKYTTSYQLHLLIPLIIGRFFFSVLYTENFLFPSSLSFPDNTTEFSNCNWECTVVVCTFSSIGVYFVFLPQYYLRQLRIFTHCSFYHDLISSFFLMIFFKVYFVYASISIDIVTIKLSFV